MLLSAERTRLGFVLHFQEGSRRILVRRRDRRPVELGLRTLGVQIVDEYGARIDETQFEKEADPAFNKNPGPRLSQLLVDSFAPMWVVRWHQGRRVGQSSDDA